MQNIHLHQHHIVGHREYNEASIRITVEPILPRCKINVIPSIVPEIHQPGGICRPVLQLDIIIKEEHAIPLVLRSGDHLPVPVALLRILPDFVAARSRMQIGEPLDAGDVPLEIGAQVVVQIHVHNLGHRLPSGDLGEGHLHDDLLGLPLGKLDGGEGLAAVADLLLDDEFGVLKHLAGLTPLGPIRHGRHVDSHIARHRIAIHLRRPVIHTEQHAYRADQAHRLVSAGIAHETGPVENQECGPILNPVIIQELGQPHALVAEELVECCLNLITPSKVENTRHTSQPDHSPVLF
mmetsp:Transcript_74893/g.171649  ORF Transcript_74893/g.171649 Transcript_74893/m.171649 type:complete len:294 (-) Transcript_74893:759-1640(-)